MIQQGTLYILGAGSSEKDWFQAGQFPFSIVFLEHFPEKADTSGILLLSMEATITYRFAHLKQMPFLCYGDQSEIDRAFLLGAKDFIRFPFDLKECTVRVSRQLFLEQATLFPEYAISLQGNILQGPKGTIVVNDEEARILRILALSEHHRIQRAVIQKHIWPDVQADSRSIDMTISRLRRKLDLISDQDKPLQIKTIYGFGYQI